MAHPTQWSHLTSVSGFFSQRTETRHIVKQRCLLKDELKMHGQTLM